MCAKKRTFCKAKILYALVSAEPQFNKHQVKISPQQIPISDESDDKNNSIINMSDWKKEKKNPITETTSFIHAAMHAGSSKLFRSAPPPDIKLFV